MPIFTLCDNNFILLTDSETILWDNLRRGDKNAFDRIFYQYVNILFNYGKKFTTNDPMVEDCIQDLFTDIWIKRNKLRGTNRIKPYLLVSVKRRILRQLSREKRSLNYDQISEFHLEFSAEEIISPEDHFTGKIDQLNNALKKLTPRQKEVIHLKYFEQLSYEEVAQVMNVNVKAIYKLMARAINSLKTDFISLLLYLSFLLK